MAMESALEAQGARRAGHPTGFRRLTPGLLKADRTAERFSGWSGGGYGMASREPRPEPRIAFTSKCPHLTYPINHGRCSS